MVGRMTVWIRAYRPEARAPCLALFDASTPGFFLPAERPDFVAWLNRLDGPGEYCVTQGDAGVLGCGGIWLRENPTDPAGFVWGTVHPDHQRQGVGTLLARWGLARLQTPSA